MLSILNPLAASLLPLTLAFGAAAITPDGPAQAGPEDPSAPRCEIRVDRQDGGVMLEGLVFAGAPLSGSYQLRVSQNGAAGSSNISQSGDFDATPGEASSLGMVSLSGSGGYVATLKVEWDGGDFTCTGNSGQPAAPRRTL